jgi:hypothetical protein
VIQAAVHLSRLVRLGLDQKCREGPLLPPAESRKQAQNLSPVRQLDFTCSCRINNLTMRQFLVSLFREYRNLHVVAPRPSPMDHILPINMALPAADTTVSAGTFTLEQWRQDFSKEWRVSCPLLRKPPFHIPNKVSTFDSKSSRPCSGKQGQLDISQ